MLAYGTLLSLLLLQRVAGMSMNEVSDPRSFARESPLQHLQPESGYPDHDGVRRFECPAGFFRLRRFCYYLSGGTAPWRDAHFQCTARNSTLAVLDRNGKDQILRKYLMGDQFKQLERWIGGIYNWRQMNWEWGVSGEKVLFQNFGNPEMISKKHSWQYHCMVLDPEQQYKWNARGCFEHKYFICEVPAGRIGQSRWRKNISSDPLAPQNQRLRPPRKDKRKRGDPSQQRRKNKLRSMRKKYYNTDNHGWAQGIKLGARPPKGSYRTSTKWQRFDGGKRPRHGRKNNLKAEPRVEQATPSNLGKYETFPGDGRVRVDEHLQSLGNDFTREEILLKL